MKPDDLKLTVEEMENGEWRVWTPDSSLYGLWIGVGTTKKEAIEDAIANLMKTASRLRTIGRFDTQNTPFKYGYETNWKDAIKNL